MRRQHIAIELVRAAREIVGFDYYKFHSSGELHRNNLLDTLEDKYGITFRDYDLSPSGIKAKNSKTEKVLSKLFKR